MGFSPDSAPVMPPDAAAPLSVPRAAKERLLGQRGLVVWLYGLSGAGKTTLTAALEQRLYAAGRLTAALDGDRLRTGLNRDLGFSQAGRLENIRRAAEVARLLADTGLITLCAFITPAREMRALARAIVGSADFLEVYLACPFAVCAQRDVKGLYARARAGEVKQFTGQDSPFEPPEQADLTLNTAHENLAESSERLFQAVQARLAHD